VCAVDVRGASWVSMVVYGRMQNGARIQYEESGLFNLHLSRMYADFKSIGIMHDTAL
jgi:hypothetical protein